MAIKLYTSYYSKSKKIPSKHPQVAISRGVPNWWQPEIRIVEKLLAPDQGFSEAGWEDRYRRKIEKMFESGQLQRIVNGLPDGAVLFCYEKDHEECHRKILMDFIVEHCGIEGGEFLTDDERDLFTGL